MLESAVNTVAASWHLQLDLACVRPVETADGVSSGAVRMASLPVLRCEAGSGPHRLDIPGGLAGPVGDEHERIATALVVAGLFLRRASAQERAERGDDADLPEHQPRRHRRDTRRYAAAGRPPPLPDPRPRLPSPL